MIALAKGTPYLRANIGKLLKSRINHFNPVDKFAPRVRAPETITTLTWRIVTVPLPEKSKRPRHSSDTGVHTRGAGARPAGAD